MHTRAKTFAAVVGIAALAVVGVDAGTYAGTGDSLILGKLNKAGKTTHVTSTGKGPALSLHAKGNRPALAVDSKSKIRRLNADRLDGVDSAAYRFISIDALAAHVQNSASTNTGFGKFSGIVLPDNATSAPAFESSIVIPPDFRAKNLKLHVLWHTSQRSCKVRLLPNFVSVGHAGGPFNVGPGATDGMTGSGPLTAPARADHLREAIYTLSSPRPAQKLRPHDVYSFGLFRRSDARDTCTSDVIVSGLWVTY
jgi:hypothetical protein